MLKTCRLAPTPVPVAGKYPVSAFLRLKCREMKWERLPCRQRVTPGESRIGANYRMQRGQVRLCESWCPGEGLQPAALVGNALRLPTEGHPHGCAGARQLQPCDGDCQAAHCGDERRMGFGTKQEPLKIPPDATKSRSRGQKASDCTSNSASGGGLTFLPAVERRATDRCLSGSGPSPTSFAVRVDKPCSARSPTLIEGCSLPARE
jgi:hypothetical protein